MTDRNSVWILCAILSVVTAQNPVVETQHGSIEGFVESTPLGVDVDVFQGIPYADPPTGPNRFTNPEFYGQFPNDTWIADSYGPACVQMEDPNNPMDVDEDCLHLNVWRPSLFRENMPVMVWFYGGAFVIGSTNNDNYDSKYLAAVGDVIVVSVDYRVNIFGFLHTGDDRLTNGNFGLLDQQMGLRWVQENIADFGGDPQQVTIFGESAGGASVNYHMLLPGSENFFNRAIMQSGDATSYWAVQSMQTVAAVAAWIADQTGCVNDDTLLDCLREIPARELHNMTDWSLASAIHPQFFLYAPVVDGVTILDNPLQMMQSGQMHRKDVLLGMNKDEGSLFVFGYPGIDENNTVSDPEGTVAYMAEEYLGPYTNLTDEEVVTVVEAYQPLDENGIFKGRIACSDMLGDVSQVCPNQRAARLFDSHGMKVYQYHLTYRASNSPNEEWQGVVHGDDIQWVFGRVFAEGGDYTEDEVFFSIEIITKWTDFAEYGSPDESWPVYSSTGGTAYADIRGPSDFVYITGDDVRGEYCPLWNLD